MSDFEAGYRRKASMYPARHENWNRRCHSNTSATTYMRSRNKFDRSITPFYNFVAGPLWTP